MTTNAELQRKILASLNTEKQKRLESEALLSAAIEAEIAFDLWIDD